MTELVAGAEMLIRRPVEEVLRPLSIRRSPRISGFRAGAGGSNPAGASNGRGSGTISRSTPTLKPWNRTSASSSSGRATAIRRRSNGRSPRGRTTRSVKVTNEGFRGTIQEAAQMATDATEGFSFVLAGAKAWLEHGIELNLVPHRFPDGLPREGDDVGARSPRARHSKDEDHRHDRQWRPDRRTGRASGNSCRDNSQRRRGWSSRWPLRPLSRANRQRGMQAMPAGSETIVRKIGKKRNTNTTHWPWLRKKSCEPLDIRPSPWSASGRSARRTACSR